MIGIELIDDAQPAGPHHHHGRACDGRDPLAVRALRGDEFRRKIKEGDVDDVLADPEVSRPISETTMLEISNLSVRYGRHQALDGVSRKIDKGEICVILGANGAGKSSLLKAIAGTVRAEPGSEIVMNGGSIAGMKAHRIVEQGIALVPEGRGIFGELTVAENLQLGAFANRARGEREATLGHVYALFPRLAERKSQIVRTMSGGEQQMVAIGRALMSQPEILMLDEPSLGLSPVLTKELFRSLARIAETGVGILLVEQNARQSLKIASRGYLIENGAITGEDTADNLRHNPAVINAYLGGHRGNA